MKKRVLGGIITILLLAGSTSLGSDQELLQTPRLPAEYAKARELVLPSPRESSYRTISWRPSVLHGLVDAQKKDRPLMIVLMNGHPLGCT
jgi:hypothetical protein